MELFNEEEYNISVKIGDKEVYKKNSLFLDIPEDDSSMTLKTDIEHDKSTKELVVFVQRKPAK